MRPSIFLFLVFLVIRPGPASGALNSQVEDSISDKQPADHPVCSISEVSRRELDVEGSLFAYFEPELLLESEGQVLFGGFPNYVAVPSEAAEGFFYRKNELIGVLMEKGGGVRTVPIPRQLQGRPFLAIRGAALGGRNWAMMLSVLPPEDRFPDQQEPDEIWFGIYGPSGWSSLERLPLEEAWHAGPRQSSRIALLGDTLAWALPVITPERKGGIKLLTRTDTGSNLEDLPVRGVSGVDLYPHPDRGLLVAITGLPEGEASEIVDVLSRSGSEWISTRVSESDGTFLSDPYFSIRGESVGWMSAPFPFAFHDSQLRAGRSFSEKGEGHLVLDGPTGGIVPLHLEVPFPTWISVQPFDSIRGGYMKFVGLTGEDQFLLDSLPNPFGNVLRGVTTENGNILLVGPDMWKVTRGEGLATLLLEFEIACSDPATQVPQ